MRFLFGLSGAVLGAILGGVIVNFLAFLMTQGDDFGMVMMDVMVGWVGLLIGAVAGVPLALWVQRYLCQDDPNGSRRVGKIRLAAGLAVGLTSAFVGMLWGPVTSSNPPSDEQLLANFCHHEATFERLAQMVQSDKQLTRVDYDWTSPTDPMTIGITPARIAEYRQLLDSVQVHRGFSASSWQNIQFLYWGQGSAISSDTDKGYAYLATPPAKVFGSLDGCEPDRQNGSVYYRHVQGNWYLYYDYLPG